MRRAEWRRRADDPTTTLGWWWRGFRDDGGIFLVSMIAFLFSAYGAGTNARWTPGAVLVFVLGQIVAERTRKRRPRPQLPDKDAASFRSWVIYRKEGMRLGGDFMSLSFVDGWLYAEGGRSTFALRPEDVALATGKFSSGGYLLLTDGGELRIEALDDRERRDLDRWCRSDNSPEGEPTFPPARVHPSELARWSAWWPVGIALAWGPNLATTLLHLGHLHSGPLWSAWLIGSGVAVFGESRARRLRVIDRKGRKDESALAGAAPPLPGL